jgi:hypothetical protein
MTEEEPKFEKLRGPSVWKDGWSIDLTNFKKFKTIYLTGPGCTGVKELELIEKDVRAIASLFTFLEAGITV